MDAASCILLPAFCSLCGSPLPHLSAAPICAACWAEIPSEKGQVCVRCGETLVEPSAPDKPCRVCRLAPPPFLRAVSFAPYQGRARQAIHALKYDGLRPAARGLGELLARAIANLYPDMPGEVLVVPVPLHHAKLADRGFNQARLLAAAAISALRKTHRAWRLTLAPSTLVRLRATESQAGLTPRQRRQNLRGAFAVSDPAAITGRHLLVIDDILTTGATARACARTLLAAGAGSVRVATLARAHRLQHAGVTENEFRSTAVSGSNPQLATMKSQNQPSF
jgi:ComF family protein